jgi:hypothetical protein
MSILTLCCQCFVLIIVLLGGCSYQDGYDNGKRAGYDAGYQEGYNKGKEVGEKEGEQYGHERAVDSQVVTTLVSKYMFPASVFGFGAGFVLSMFLGRFLRHNMPRIYDGARSIIYSVAMGVHDIYETLYAAPELTTRSSITCENSTCRNAAAPEHVISIFCTYCGTPLIKLGPIAFLVISVTWLLATVFTGFMVGLYDHPKWIYIYVVAILLFVISAKLRFYAPLRRHVSVHFLTIGALVYTYLYGSEDTKNVWLVALWAVVGAFILWPL